MLTAPAGSTDFENPPEGTHIARCYRVIDLGTTHNERFDKDQHNVLISWELPEELMKEGDNEGKPFSVHKRYTLSMHEKSNLRRDLESWRGVKFTDEQAGSFDISKIVGQPCMLAVIHHEGYANISAVMKLPKSSECPPQVNKSVVFVLNEFDEEVYTSLSDKLKQQIGKSKEYQVYLNDMPEEGF